jgi:hypothetical protein
MTHLAPRIACLVAGIASAGSLLSGCNSTEVGNPPFDPAPSEPGFVPEEVDAAPDRGRIPGIEWRVPQTDTGITDVVRVRLTVLDSMQAAVLLEPDTDGSFRGTVRMEVGQEARLQAIRESGRGSPVDFVLQEETRAVPVERPLGDCLEWEQLEVVFATGALDARTRVRNGCTGAVDFATPRYRIAEPDGVDVARVPTRLAPGDVGTLELVRARPEPVADAILFVETTAPSESRIPITVRGE